MNQMTVPPPREGGTPAGSGTVDRGLECAPGGPPSDRAPGGGPPADRVDLNALLADSHVMDVLDELEAELIGLRPVKSRIRDIAALLLVQRARSQVGLAGGSPSLHMSFTGNPGTGKTTVALRMAQILHRLGYVRKGHLVAVTRDDLVGQYIGHTAPKTKEILKKAMGGVLFIDEAYYLYRPENERDYGQEAIEILLQVMENQRDDLVVILAGYADRMQTFFRSNPGLSSRIAHHLAFPDYSADELEQIARRMLDSMQYRLTSIGRSRPARLHPAAHAAAALRQCALDPQCARPGAPTSSQSAVRAKGAPARSRCAHDHRG